MAKTIAVRINDKIEQIIKKNVEELKREKKDQSDIITSRKSRRPLKDKVSESNSKDI